MARGEAPGRVNLIGEHTDYNEGLVLPAPVPQRTYVQLEPRGDDQVRVASAGFGATSYRLGQERRAGDWADHVRGVTSVLGTAIRGFDAVIRSDVPPGAGLASSAALAVALLRALREAFALELDDTALALAAHRAETELVGARVGSMDQLVASRGTVGEALLIDTRTLAVDRVALPDQLALVVVHSGVTHEHATGGYNTRRSECEDAARLLGVRALRDATPDDLGRLTPHPILLRRVRHVVTENERVAELVAALRASDLTRCGALVDESHVSLRDDYAVSHPDVDVLRDILREQPGVYGARITGGGFGGCVLAIASPQTARLAADSAARAYHLVTGRSGRVVLPV